MGLFDFLTESLGVEAGSRNLRIIKDGELAFDEPSHISIDNKTKVVTGIGATAIKNNSSTLIEPVHYTLKDFHAFEMLLRGAIKKIQKPGFFPKTYRLYFSIPSNTTEVEKRAYRDSGEHAGGKEIYLIYENCAAAIGMKILFERKDFILIDFGKSKFEITAFADSIPFATGVIKFGTSKVFQLLKNFLFREYKISISDMELENILNETKLSASTINIRGVNINIVDLKTPLNSYFYLVNDELQEVNEIISSHPNISKILANGIYMTGGGIKNEFLFNEIAFDKRIPLHKSENPTKDASKGLQVVMKDLEKFKNYLMT